MSVGKPLQEMRFSGLEVRIADAHRLKSQCLPPRFDACGKRVVICLRYLVLHEPNHSRINLPDEVATTDFATLLSHTLRPGLVIYLRGDLGAGKTTLVRGLLRALGYSGRVKSPTYTLIEQYDLAELKLRHFDLYRFRDAEEWEAAGFRDEFNGCNICMVEWPEQAAGLLPPADLEICFTIRPDSRTLDLYAHTDTGKQCLTSLPV